MAHLLPVCMSLPCIYVLCIYAVHIKGLFQQTHDFTEFDRLNFFRVFIFSFVKSCFSLCVNV